MGLNYWSHASAILWPIELLYVRPSLYQRFFSATIHQIFLIFCMKLSFRDINKVTEPDFWKKLLFGTMGPKRVIFGPKMHIFWVFLKTLHRIFLKFCTKMKHSKGKQMAVLIFFGKFLFCPNGPKCAIFRPKFSIFALYQHSFNSF